MFCLDGHVTNTEASNGKSGRRDRQSGSTDGGKKTSTGNWCIAKHRFRHSVGTMLAEMGEHQLTIRDYLRHSNLHVTNKYLQATSRTKRLAQDKLVDAILPTGILPKTNLIQ